MVQMCFFIRFHAQLRRVRPLVLSRLSDAFNQAVAAGGGQAVRERRFLAASFDDTRIGFWLDMAMLLENFLNSLEADRRELSGHALVIGHSLPDDDLDMERLLRELSSAAVTEHTGVWCARGALRSLEPYACFAPALHDGYGELTTFRNPVAPEPRPLPSRAKIERAFSQSDGRGVLITGPEFLGKRDGAYRFAGAATGAATGGATPPLAVRFGQGGRGPACFADALTPEIRAFLAAAGADLDPLDALQRLLSKERLREEISPSLAEAGRRFLTALIAAYAAAASAAGAGDPPPRFRGAVVIENPQTAEERTGRVLRETLEGIAVVEGSGSLLFMGIADTQDGDQGGPGKEWAVVFPWVLKFTADDAPPPVRAELPGDVWEASYAAAILGRYYPSWLLPELFEEAGLNRGMPAKAARMLYLSGLAAADDGSGRPRPRIPGFVARAEKTLGDRVGPIRAMVRGRLLAWVDSGRLSPCFSLLKILAELGGGAGDDLILRAIREDVYSGAFAAIEDALRWNRFNALVGEGNAAALTWIYRTLKALVHGGAREIREAFAAPPPAVNAAPLIPARIRAQIQVNLTAYQLGIKATGLAAETVKEAMFLHKSARDIPAYRLFSLTNLCRRRFDDAAEYISFAIEHAEKADDPEELTKSAYFAASIHLLAGSLSRALTFIHLAERSAAGMDRAEWTGRARFLRGRLLFEAGRYQDALDVFNTLEGVTRSRVHEAWAYRARVYLAAGARRMETVQRPRDAGADGRLFEIEAAFLSGRDREALSLAESFFTAAAGDDDDDFFYIEQPDWRSGFAQAEGMLYTLTDLRGRLAAVYRALAQSRLKTGDDPAAWMRDFLRSVQPDGDPHDAFYYYASYRVLRESGAPPVDMGTAVSMAYKRFQRRANRIDDSDLRRSFAEDNHWNRALNQAAREYKLV